MDSQKISIDLDPDLEPDLDESQKDCIYLHIKDRIAQCDLWNFIKETHDINSKVIEQINSILIMED